jgi:DNA-binding transcriptional MerR regulator
MADANAFHRGELLRRFPDLNSDTLETWAHRGILKPVIDAQGRRTFTAADEAEIRRRLAAPSARRRAAPALSVQDVLDVLPTSERGLVEADLETYAPVLATEIREALS